MCGCLWGTCVWCVIWSGVLLLETTLMLQVCNFGTVRGVVL